mgnify:CR=1 FL=1
MIWYVIPARKNSKGYPNKNRHLLNLTLDDFPHELYENLIVTTDDEYIQNKLDEKINILQRKAKLSEDSISIKDVLKDVVENYKIKDSDTVVMLYLTYPGRTFEDIVRVLEFFKNKKADSLLCRMRAHTQPYLCMEAIDNFKGKQAIKHNLYRRQDYPECFELSHFICIFKAKELKKLNLNMYNKDTFFYPVQRHIDVDYKEDYKKYNEEVE